jgi:uncharacterized protein (DUF488 family)
MDLLTFGYEGLTPSQFLTTLRDNHVGHIIDVRARPQSRKAGFSKKGLADAIADYGMAYSHMVALGCPQPIRDAYRNDRNWGEYSHKFLAYLDSQQSTIIKLAPIVQQERCCLVCFEADANFCHRKFIAQRLLAMGAVERILHLTYTTIPTSVAELVHVVGR